MELTKKENIVKFYGYRKLWDFDIYIQLEVVLLSSDSLFQSLIWFYDLFFFYGILDIVWM